MLFIGMLRRLPVQFENDSHEISLRLTMFVRLFIKRSQLSQFMLACMSADQALQWALCDLKALVLEIDQSLCNVYF